MQPKDIVEIIAMPSKTVISCCKFEEIPELDRPAVEASAKIVPEFSGLPLYDNANYYRLEVEDV